MNVGDLLRAHPELSFDLEDYILSTRYAEHLVRRRGEFVAARRSGRAGAYRNRVLAALRGRLRALPAYGERALPRDWNDVPLIGKGDLRARPDAFVLPRDGDDEIWSKTTTGSTGPPIHIRYGAPFYFELLFSIIKAVLAGGLDDLRGNRGVLGITVSDIHQLGEYVFADPTGQAGLTVHAIVDASRPETLDRIWALAAELQPQCISTKPSLLELLCARRPDGAWMPKLVVSGGACLSRSVRDRVWSAFGAKTIDVYGMTEVGVIAASCDTGAWHIDPSSCHVEIVDGEIVVTAIENDAMPLARYRTGDNGTLATGACGCGAASPRLIELSGRRMTCFRLSDGTLFAPTYFNDVFGRFPTLREFQLSQIALDEFELLAEIDSGLDALAAHVRASLPTHPVVRASATRFVPDAKFQRYRTCFND
ncbi:MAG: AMP-binding protein [Thermoanaerobaculia bacterium]